MNTFKNIISRFNKKRILVIGDVVLDQYISGSVSRISPEAPVPVVSQEGDPVFTPGGAANVAANLKGLGAAVTLVGRIGKDQDGKVLLKELRKKHIDSSGICVDAHIPTTVKTRIIAQHQQVVRLDRERVVEVQDGAVYQKIIRFIKENIGSFDALVISDYGKGMITPALVSFVCTLALNKKKIITIDPKIGHFNYYASVTAITPNKKELENAISNIKITSADGRRLGVHKQQLTSDADVNAAGEALVKFLRLESLLVTLGEHGMRLFERGKRPVHIDTRAQEVFDVTGAGDTVIAVFTLSLAAGANKHLAADLANYAAGVVVGKMGAVPITKKELFAALGHQ